MNKRSKSTDKALTTKSVYHEEKERSLVMPFGESKVEVCYVTIEKAHKRDERTSKSKTGEKLFGIVRYAFMMPTQVFLLLSLIREPHGYPLIIILSICFAAYDDLGRPGRTSLSIYVEQ